MPPPNTPQRLMPSIMDRLLDPDSGSSKLGGYNERQMLDAVRADLEELLNTRKVLVNLHEKYVETRDSIATYGLPDLVNFNPSQFDECAELAKSVATIIGRNEPRLRRVRVKIIRGGDNTSDARSLRFHIDAQLNVDPSPEVGFETVVELTTGRASVKQEGDSK